MAKIKLLNVGFGNIVPTNEVIAIVSPASAPIKRLVQKAKEEKGLKDEATGKEKRKPILSPRKLHVPRNSFS